MILFIVESPGKVKTIQKYLGDEFKVVASVGHVRDMPTNRMGVEAPNYTPEYELTERGAEVVARLRKQARNASAVILATDDDREGEAIAWHLQECLDVPDAQRVRFNEITPNAISMALGNKSQVNMGRVREQEARRVLDRLFGYKVSGLLNKLSPSGGLSAGRVQSVALRLLFDREQDIQNFQPTDHWGVKLTMGNWWADLDTKALLPEGEKYLLDKAVAEKAARCRRLEVTACDDSTKRKGPPAPFITSTLQKAASNALKMSPGDTMKAAQALYESGAITYMRTDNPNLSDTGAGAVRHWLTEQGIAVPDSPRTWKTKADAQAGHEAIRPTDPGQETAGANQAEQSLYALIRNRTVASQMMDAVFSVRKAKLAALDTEGEEFSFVATGSVRESAGWQCLLKGDDAEDKAEDQVNNPVPLLRVGQVVNALDGELVAKRTKAPTRFTEAHLVDALEKMGIGRPSTYAAILANLQHRQYVQQDKQRRLSPTERGVSLVTMLLKANFAFMEYAFTAEMESRIEKIGAGEGGYRQIVGTYDADLDQQLGAVPATAFGPVHDCPKCGQPMRLINRPAKRGKNARPASRFWGCSGYPKCDHTQPDVNGKPGEREPAIVAEIPCPECGSELHKRNGAKGPFWSCASFPQCRYSAPDDNGKPGQRPKSTDSVKCPECASPMVFRHKPGKKGYSFYGCSAYPKCKGTIQASADGKPVIPDSTGETP